MEGKFAVTVRIADKSYKLRADTAAEESLVRKGAEMINQRLEHYRKLGANTPQEALSMVAIDCMVARLKGDIEVEKFQKLIATNVEHLRSIMGPLAEASN